MVLHELAPVVAATNAAVAYKVVGPGLPGSSGVSLYFPPDASTYRKSYDNLPVVAGWSKFLNSYYTNGASSGGASRAYFDDNEGTTQTTADHEFVEQGAFLTTPFQVNDAETITDVRIRYGLQDDSGAPVLVGESTGFVHPWRRWHRGWSLGSERARRERRRGERCLCIAS